MYRSLCMRATPLAARDLTRATGRICRTAAARAPSRTVRQVEMAGPRALETDLPSLRRENEREYTGQSQKDAPTPPF